MQVGEDVIIHPWTEITLPELCVIKNHVAIDMGFYCTTQLEVGNYVHISPHVTVIGGKTARLIVGDFCFISAGARMICASETITKGKGLVGPLIPQQYKDEIDNSPVILEKFSGVFANAVVLPGVTMAVGSVLGANSLLKTSTEPWTIYAGSPARPIKIRPKENIIKYAEELGY